MTEFFGSIEERETAKVFYWISEFTQLAPSERGQVSLKQLGNAQEHTLKVLHET